MSVLQVTLFLLSLGIVSAVPAHLRALHAVAHTGDFVHGDIKLTEQQKFARNVHSKLFINDYAQKWTNNVVPITFSDDLTQENRQKIRQGLKSIEEKTCFRFPDKKPEDKDYIKFKFDTTPNAPCWSSLGRVGGEQSISFVQGCIDDPLGTVTHEVLHALGMNHEHERPDRDDYIEMDPDWGSRFGYAKIETKMDLKRFPYDIHSVMHYEGFQINNEQGKLIRMLYIKGTDTPVPRPKKLSDEDIHKLNDFGNCPATSNGSGQSNGTDRKNQPRKVTNKRRPIKKRRQQRRRH